MSEQKKRLLSPVSDEGPSRHMSGWLSTGEVRGGAICLCFWAIFCCFLLGYLGHWNRDRDCEPAQLTGCLLGGQASSLPSTEHRTPLRLSTPSGGGFISKVPLDRGVAQAVRNNSAPPKWSKLW